MVIIIGDGDGEDADLHLPFIVVLLVVPLIVGTMAPAFAHLAHHRRVAVVGAAVDVVHLVAGGALLPLRARQGLQVGVVDGELDVVLLEDVGGCPLDGEVAKGEGG